MKKRQEYDDALAAEYALGTLRGPARLNFENRLQSDGLLAKRVAEWQTLFSGLDSSIIPVIPPESVWKRISLSLPVRQRAPNHLLPWALAACIGILSLTAWYTLRPPQMMPLVVLSGTQQGQWVVSTDTDKKVLSITPLNTLTIAENKSYELWVIPAGKKPESLGLLKETEATRVELAEGQIAPGATIAISLEPHGGSPTAQPTGPVLFVGQLKT